MLLGPRLHSQCSLPKPEGVCWLTGEQYNAAGCDVEGQSLSEKQGSVQADISRKLLAAKYSSSSLFPPSEKILEEDSADVSYLSGQQCTTK